MSLRRRDTGMSLDALPGERREGWESDDYVARMERAERVQLDQAVEAAVQQAVAEAVARLDGMRGVVVQNLNITVNVGMASGGGATTVVGSDMTTPERLHKRRP